MSDYPLHTLETAPEKSRPLLEASQKEMGMIPNLHAVMAQSPSVLEVILGLSRKTLSNYTNHIAETPMDKPFEKFRWSKS